MSCCRLSPYHAPPVSERATAKEARVHVLHASLMGEGIIGFVKVSLKLCLCLKVSSVEGV